MRVGRGKKSGEGLPEISMARESARGTGLNEPQPDELSVLLHPGHAASADGDSPGKPSRSWTPHTRDLLILSTSFLLVFSAFGATQNLESSLNTDEGLGSTSLGVLYCSLTLFSVLAPLVVKGLGSKRALLLGLTGYWLFVAANLAPSWGTLIPASAYLGFTASILWVAQGTYLSFAAKGHAALCSHTEEAALGSFNGIFWGFMQSNQVVGNLLSLFLLHRGSVDPASPDRVSNTTTTLLFAVFLAIMSVGTALAFFLRLHVANAPLAAPAAPRGPVALLRESMGLLLDRRMQLLLMLLVYSGLQQAFIWSDFTKDVITPALGVSWVGGVMAAYGAADALGSLAAGKLSAGLPAITAITSTGAAVQFVVVAFLIVKQSFDTSWLSYLLLFGTASLWGLGDATFNTQISSLLAIYFPNDTEAAFAQFKIWQSAATSAACFATPHLAFTTKLVVLGSTLLVSISGFLRCTLSHHPSRLTNSNHP